ncbi:MAG: hypothetical protein ACT4PV_07080 [Planctomycetaceae bacterium]
MTDEKKPPGPGESASDEKVPGKESTRRQGRLGRGEGEAPTHTEFSGGYFNFSGELTGQEGEPLIPPFPDDPETRREIESTPPRANPAEPPAPVEPPAPAEPAAPVEHAAPSEPAAPAQDPEITRTEGFGDEGFRTFEAPEEGIVAPPAPRKEVVEPATHTEMFVEGAPLPAEPPATRTEIFGDARNEPPAPPAVIGEGASEPGAATATDLWPRFARRAAGPERPQREVERKRTSPAPLRRVSRRRTRKQAAAPGSGAMPFWRRFFRAKEAKRAKPAPAESGPITASIEAALEQTASVTPKELQTDSSFLRGLGKIDGIDEAAAESAGIPAPSPEEAAASLQPAKTLKQRFQEFLKSFRPGPEAKLARVGEPGWWRRAILETAALFAIIIPIELAVNGGRVGAYGVHPHPYWIVVLPMAAARGVVAGLLAACVATLLYMAGAMQVLGASALGALFTYKTMLEPILFFGAGFLVGEFRDEIALRYRHLDRKEKETEARAIQFKKERDVLMEANRILERRIVDHSGQFGNLIAAATRIESAGRSEIFEVALELVEEHCGAHASVLLVLEGGAVDMLCHRGWPEDGIAQRVAEARGSEFVARAIAEGVTANSFSATETPPERGPLVVAPLFDETGVVKALLCLDEIPASRLNESTITTFQGIAEWISASLARLAKGAEPSDPRAGFQREPEPEAYLGTVDELGDRLRLEIERCARYGVPTSFLAIQAAEWRDSSREGLWAVDRYVLTHFSGGLRPSDTIYRFGYPGCYLLVLAGTNLAGAEVVRTRMLRRVEFSPVTQLGRVEIFATGPDTEAPDLVSLASRVAERFRAAAALPLEGVCPVRVPESAKVGGIDAFLRRVKMEISLAVRNGFDLHVLGITAEVRGEAGPDMIARHVRDAGAAVLRQTDGIFAIAPHQCVVLLPSTAGEYAAEIGNRLVRGVRARDPDGPYGDIRVRTIGLGPSHPDAGSFLQALARADAAQPEPAPLAEGSTTEAEA